MNIRKGIDHLPIGTKVFTVKGIVAYILDSFEDNKNAVWYIAGEKGADDGDMLTAHEVAPIIPVTYIID